MTRTRRIDLLAWSEVAERLKESDLAIVPVGALEPHGHHAPLGTDTFIAAEIADRLAEATNGLIFPPLPLGAMNVVYDFRSLPGTVSIDPRVLIELYTNIGVELGRSGVNRLVLVNGHAGNTPILGIVAYQIRERAGVQVGILEWWATSEAEIRDIKGFTFASHADEIETSVVMATAEGSCVDLARAAVNSTTLEALTTDEADLYRAKIPFTRVLDERWIGRSGNMGDPTKATAEKGERIIRQAVKVGVQLARVLAQQRQPPGGPTGG
jgi:creatinine amidohydrolase